MGFKIPMNLTALRLTEAKTAIRNDPATQNLDLKIIETAPPFVPKNRAPIWGEWRVLRARKTENTLELLIAREQLGEEKPVFAPRNSIDNVPQHPEA